MASDAIVAPFGSPFLTELGNLTAAWHHYLAQPERLIRGLTITDQGAALTDIEVRIAQLEALVAVAEVELQKRNWAFFFAPEAQSGGSEIIINHGLNTRFIVARAEFNSDARYSLQSSARIVDETAVGVSGFAGGSNLQGWVLGFYGYD